MKIDGEHSVIPPIGKRADRPEPESTKVRRGRLPADAVEISADGKAAPHASGCRDAADTEGRMRSTFNQIKASLHERINNGFYDSDDVLQGVAGKILDLFGL